MRLCGETHSWAIVESFRILYRNLQVIHEAHELSVEELGGVWFGGVAAFRKINWRHLKGGGVGSDDFGSDGVDAVLDKSEEMAFVAEKDGKGEKEWHEGWGHLEVNGWR